MPTKREQEILNLIRENPMISQKELAETLGITRPGVASHISHLIQEGLITGKGYILPTQDDYVTVIGAVNMDIFGTASNETIVPEITNPGKINTQLGGMGRNIAANLTELGIKTNFITVFGDDPYGHLFKQDSLRRSINLDFAYQLSAEPTSIYLYVNQKDGRRVISIDDMEINQHITPAMLRKSMTMINHSKLVIFDSNLPAKTISWLYKNVQAPLIAKAVAINKAPNLLQQNAKLTALVINSVEATALTRLDVTDMDSAINCARQLHKLFHTTIYLYTDNLGIVIDNGQKQVRKEYHEPLMTSLNGVGTSIVAAVAYARLHHKSLEDAIQLAVRAAKITASTPQNVSDEIKGILL